MSGPFENFIGVVQEIIQKDKRRKF
ncbi:hypothetical protein [Thermoanaerobacter sp. YS13]|nr:hypothetical protein [Thermoanaerobacter sp. YS13]